MLKTKCKSKLQTYFDGLLADIHNVKIKSICTNCWMSTDDYTFTGDDLLIHLENGYTIVIDYLEIDELSIDYVETSSILSAGKEEVFNYDRPAGDRSEVYFGRLAYGSIQKVTIRSVTQPYYSWESGKLDQKEPMPETFDEITFEMDNGLDFSICPEDADADGYLDIRSKWAYRTVMNLSKPELQFSMKDLSDDKKQIVWDLVDNIKAMQDHESDNFFTVILMMCGTFENVEQLSDFLKFKHPFYTMSDVIKYCTSLERRRIQYLPQHMFVRWIKETNERYNQGDYYRVHTVYNRERNRYYLQNETDGFEEIDSSNFIELQESEIIYTGEQVGEDKFEPRDGLKIGATYNVQDAEEIMLHLENGKQCLFYQTRPVTFIPKKEKPRLPLSRDVAFDCVKCAFNYGDTAHIYKRLSDHAELYSENKGQTIKGKDAICNYLEKTARLQVESKVFADVYEATIDEEVTDGSGHFKGELFLACRYSDIDSKQAIYIETDDVSITKITVVSRLYDFIVNEYFYSKQGEVDLAFLSEEGLREIALEVLDGAKGTDNQKEEAKTILKNEKKEDLKRFIRFYSRNINVNIQSYLESKTTTNDS